MAGNADGGLPSHIWRYGRDRAICSRPFSDTRDGFFPPQFLFAGKGRIWRWLDAFDDRIVFGRISVFFDFIHRSFGGIHGRNGIAYASENTPEQGGSFCAVSAFGNGGGGVLLRKRVNGYMTLEASFIISWTVFLFVLLIYLSFYSYDKCVLFQDAYAVCFRGSIQKEDGQVAPYIDAHIQKQFGKKYFGVGRVTGTVDKNGNTTSVTGECQVKTPVRQLFTMHDKAGWKIQTRAKAQIINPTKMIRKSRMAGNVISGLTE